MTVGCDAVVWLGTTTHIDVFVFSLVLREAAKLGFPKKEKTSERERQNNERKWQQFLERQFRESMMTKHEINYKVTTTK